ncbi:hypothetical protein, partial [Serratia marcescens]|uniref:hypothetical protein n=1 Tax=Serratia marcescens TaxID=615 RepID=UPI001C37E2AE
EKNRRTVIVITGYTSSAPGRPHSPSATGTTHARAWRHATGDARSVAESLRAHCKSMFWIADETLTARGSRDEAFAE